MGIATLLGRPRGFFIPYRYAAGVSQAEAPGPDSEIAQRFAACEATFAAWLAALAPFAMDFARIGTAPPPAPRWDQDWFPRLDAAMAWAMVATHKPARIIEIGSGHSTRFLAHAVAHHSPATRITAIDPAPRAKLADLPVTRIAKTLQQAMREKTSTLSGGFAGFAGFAGFGGLKAGDILFIDSSHILMPGTDVDVLLNRILPTLREGVIVHVHDIFLPDPYPAAWRWRGYNEQQALGPLISCGAFEPLFSSYYVQSRMQEALAQSIVATLPLPANAYETSLWLRKAAR